MSYGHHHDEEENLHEEAQGHFNEEDEMEELIEPSGILNDLSFRDEEEREIDLGEFFPVGKAFAISHNKERVFSDMKSWKAKPLNFAKKRTIEIGKSKPKHHDILSKKKQSRGVIGYFQDSSQLRIDPIAIIEPLGELPENFLDIRELSPLFAVRYPDIYTLPPTISRRIRRFARKHHKAIVRGGFAAAAVGAIILSTAAGAAYLAKSELESGYGNLEWLSRVKTFDELSLRSGEALSHFRTAKPLLDAIGLLLDTPVYSSDKIRSAEALADGGKSVADAVNKIQLILSEIAKDGKIQNVADIESAFSSGSQVKVTDILKSHDEELSDTEKLLGDAISSYSRVWDLGNTELQEKFNRAVQALFFVKEAISAYRAKEDTILYGLWDERPMRYLILNQNRDELRASGGFPGSAIFIEFYKGRISKYEKRDIYYYDWHLFPFAETSPEWIREISDKLGLRDANYDPEFSKNFATVDRLYQKAGGSSLDGLLAINQSLIVDLLDKYGSVEIPSIRKTVDSKNFSTLMSLLVEAQIGRKSSAKDILFEFIGEFEKKLLSIRDYEGYFAIAKHEVEQGEILFASNDEKLSTLANNILGDSEGWKGDTGNFIHPVFTSFSANKSDRYISRKFEITSKIIAPTSVSGSENSLSWATNISDSSSMILNSFALDSVHTMTIDDREKIRSLLYEFEVPTDKHEQLIYVEWAGKNRSWIRLIVPKGSKIFGIPPMAVKTDDSDSRFTVFSFEVTTEFLGNSRVFLDYLTPLKSLNEDPKAKFYRQSGLENYTVTIK